MKKILIISSIVLIIVTIFSFLSCNNNYSKHETGLILAYESINSGWKNNNEFSVTNNGSSRYCYDLVIKDYVNTFVSTGLLQYKIYKDNSLLVDYTDLPKSIEQTVNLYKGICIDVGAVHNYNVSLTYNSSSSSDIGASVSGLFKVEMTKFNVVGSVNNSAYGSVNDSSVTYNGSTSLTASPSTGYYLESASCTNGYTISNMVTGKSAINTQSVTVNNNGQENDSVCTFNYSIRTFNVNVNVTNGTVTGEREKTVNYNSDTSFTINANAGYDLSRATVTSGGCTISNNIVTASNVTDDVTCNINVPSVTYTVAYNINYVVPPQGGKTSDEFSDTVSYGTSSTLDLSQIEFEEYSDVANITVTSGGCTITNNKVTISNVTSDLTCNINVPLKNYTVTIKVNGENTSATTIRSIYYGHNDEFDIPWQTNNNISTSNGYNFDNATIVSGPCTLSNNNTLIRAYNITQNTSCEINVPLYTYQVALTCNNCSTTSTNPQMVKYNKYASWTITVASGYSLTGASTNGCSISGTTVTASNVTSTRSCTVTAAVDMSVYNGYYWVMLSDGKTYAYNSAGTLLSSSNNNGTFTIPYTGTYSVEVHGGGGGGSGKSCIRQCWGTRSGATGGGSGNIWTNISFSKNVGYAVHVGTGGLGGTSEGCTYKDSMDCPCGACYTSGAGATGGYSSLGVYRTEGGNGASSAQICTMDPGDYCNSTVKSGYDGTNGTHVGNLGTASSGGSTIGTYGNGGGPGDSPSRYNVVRAASGTDGAVIVRLTSATNVTPSTLPLGSYWIFLDDGYTYAYDPNGTLLSKTATNNSFTIPYTGKYDLEIHGGGGGGAGGAGIRQCWSAVTGGNGGGSGQYYSSISFSSNQSVNISIGAGGTPGTAGNHCNYKDPMDCPCSACYSSPSDAGNGGTTRFGTYQIAGGGAGSGSQICTNPPGDYCNSTVGSTSGGTTGTNSGNISLGTDGGCSFGSYGNGGGGGGCIQAGNTGSPGAIKLLLVSE